MAITINDNFQNNSPKSLDNKYLSGGTTVYPNLATVYTSVPSAYRHRGLKVRVAISGEDLEYWWKYGTADADLIPVSLEKFGLTGDGTKALLVGEFYKRIVIRPTAGVSAFKIGTTPGGEEILPEQPLTGATWIVVNLDRYISSATTLYFTGVTVTIDFRLYND